MDGLLLTGSVGGLCRVLAFDPRLNAVMMVPIHRFFASVIDAEEVATPVKITREVTAKQLRNKRLFDKWLELLAIGKNGGFRNVYGGSSATVLTVRAGEGQLEEKMTVMAGSCWLPLASELSTEMKTAYVEADLSEFSVSGTGITPLLVFDHECDVAMSELVVRGDELWLQSRGMAGSVGSEGGVHWEATREFWGTRAQPQHRILKIGGLGAFKYNIMKGHRQKTTNRFVATVRETFLAFPDDRFISRHSNHYQISLRELERDDMTSFYYNASFLIQRIRSVLIVDTVKRDFMLTTPARALSYLVRKERARGSGMGKQFAAEIGVDFDIQALLSNEELQEAYTTLLRYGKGTIIADDGAANVSIRAPGSNLNIVVPGYSTSEGWGTFIRHVQNAVSNMTVVLEGNVTSKEVNAGGWELVVADTEAEVIHATCMHTQRAGVVCKALQFRGGHGWFDYGNFVHMPLIAGATAGGFFLPAEGHQRPGEAGFVWRIPADAKTNGEGFNGVKPLGN